MKKIFLISALILSLSFCGCSGQSNNSEKSESSSSQRADVSTGESGTTYTIRDVSKDMSTGDRIEITENKKEVSAPKDSISFKEACDIIDSCNMEELYLPQSAKDYKKMYFATVNYESKDYYSIYNCVEVKGKKIPVGTNCLVACDGSRILKKDWVGGYSPVDTDTAKNDKTTAEKYPDAKITPNEAIAAAAEKGDKLGLEYDISTYVFEADDKIVEVNGVACYKFTPKSEYTNSTLLQTAFYVNAYGSGEVYLPVIGSDEYTTIS